MLRLWRWGFEFATGKPPARGPDAEGHAGVDLRGDSIIVSSLSPVGGRVTNMNGWFVILDGGVEDAELGQTVSHALDYSRHNFGKTGPDVWAPVFERLGVSGWDEYSRGRRCVTIKGGEQIEVTPMRRHEDFDGYFSVEDAVIELGDGVQPDELGRAVRDALEKAG